MPEQDPAPTPRELHQAQRLRAAVALRAVIERLAGTEASLEELEAVASACERVGDLLPPVRRTSRYQPCLPQGAEATYDIPFDTDCVIGGLNPLAAPYTLERREPPVSLSGRFTLAYEGVPGQVQGGHLMAGCDWAMAVAASSVAMGVVTGTMSTRFSAPAPVGALIRIEARPDRVEGRKLFTKAVVTADGVVCATAEAIFIAREGLRVDPLSLSMPAPVEQPGSAPASGG